MLKNNLYLNNKISLALQEEPISFFFVNNCTGIIRSHDEQFVMSKNTKDRLTKSRYINSGLETMRNTLIVDNLIDGFAYMGKVYEEVKVNSDGEISIDYPGSFCLMYIK